MAWRGMEKKEKQQESRRDLGRKLLTFRETEALGKQSLVFEAKAWKSSEFVLQHSPGAGTAQGQCPGAPTLTWHTLSCSQPIPQPLYSSLSKGWAQGSASPRLCSPARTPQRAKALLQHSQILRSWAWSSGKRVCMHPKKWSWFPLPLCCGSNRGSSTQIWTKL